MHSDASHASLETAAPAPNVGNHSMAAPATRKRTRSRRATFLVWLRKIHLYVGLWGALIGLLFGATGILMNHRAVLKIDIQKTVQKTAQLPLPARSFASPDDMVAWLQQQLGFTPIQKPLVKTQPAKKIIWADREVTQPANWTVTLLSPHYGVKAEYFLGNRFVNIEQTDATPIGTLTRLHMAVGVNAFWVLLADTIAGSFILLAITGLLLWTQLHTVRTAAVLTSVSALLAATWFMWAM